MLFTKEEVKTAFLNLEEKGIKPMPNNFASFKEERKLCGVCVLTAIAIYKGIITIEEIETSPYSLKVMDGLQDLYDLRKNQLYDIIDGFDGNRFKTLGEGDEKIYNFGKEIREEILGGQQ